MKIYTKTGDNKTTGVIGGRVSKSSKRIESYGTCDEALAYIGNTYYYLEDEIIKNQVKKTMELIFFLSSDIANVNKDREYFINEQDTALVESYIDYLEMLNDPQDSFILPAAHPSASAANIARTVLRRAERRIVDFSLEEEINSNILPLINRLSDYYYVLFRYLNKINNYQEMKMDFNK